MKRTIAELKNALPAGATYLKRVDNNTIEFANGNARGWLLHETVIATIFPAEGRVILNSGGYKTPTTKDRINNFLRLQPSFLGLQIVQSKGKWFVYQYKNPSTYAYEFKELAPFVDGMVIESVTDGTGEAYHRYWKFENTGESAQAEETRLLKLIDKYCIALRKLDELPEPNGGDCFMCQFGFGDGKEHLVSHLEEGYIMGSLIIRALQAAGYGNPALVWQMKLRDNIVRAVRRYFKKELGLAA